MPFNNCEVSVNTSAHSPGNFTVVVWLQCLSEYTWALFWHQPCPSAPPLPCGSHHHVTSCCSRLKWLPSLKVLEETYYWVIILLQPVFSTCTGNTDYFLYMHPQNDLQSWLTFQNYSTMWLDGTLPELLADDLVALAILLVVLTFSFASLTSKSNHGNSNSLRMEKINTADNRVSCYSK